MDKPLLFICVFFSWLVPLSATAQSSLSECESNACLEAKMVDHPATRYASWQTQLSLPLSERIAVAPVDLLDYIAIDNALNGYTSIVSNSARADQNIALIREAVSALPQRVIKLLEKKLAGILIVEGLGSTGYTERIVNDRGESVAGIIVLDSELLEKSANEWASWKLSTAFFSDPLYEIRVTLESPEEDSQVNAIQFILLHEMGHVLSIASDFHPGWWQAVEQTSIEDYPFVLLSWKLNDDAHYVSLFEPDFPLRQSLVFYREPRLKAEQMVTLLGSLQQTNYVSPYASTSVYEDFAETFALYVHSEMMQKPYYVEALLSGVPLLRVNGCFSTRCSDKQQFMRNWLLAAKPQVLQENRYNRTK